MTIAVFMAIRGWGTTAHWLSSPPPETCATGNMCEWERRGQVAAKVVLKSVHPCALLPLVGCLRRGISAIRTDLMWAAAVLSMFWGFLNTIPVESLLGRGV